MTEKFKNGKPFVVVEGGSGVGKTTTVMGLIEQTPGWGHFREPGGTPFGNLMREAVQDQKDMEVDPTAAFMAYSASRANLVNLRIIPALTGTRESQGVLLDRYWFSTYAYQGAEKVDKGVILYVSKLVTGGLMPDLVLHFDLDPEIAERRRMNRREQDRYDLKKMDFHERIREGYLELSVMYPEIWKIIDASQSPEAVLADALAVMRERGMI